MDDLDKLLNEIRSQPQTKREWVEAIDAYKAEHGTTKGFQEGKLQYTDADGVVWDYRAGSKRNPRGGARRASATGSFLGRRDDNAVKQTIGAEDVNAANRMFKKAGRDAGVTSAEQMHHMRTLNQFEPLLAGLSPTETAEAIQWFADEGFALGNDPRNLKKMFMNQEKGGTAIADTHQGVGSIHEYMRENRMEPMTTQDEYKQLKKLFEGKSLNERLPMFVQYLNTIQGDLQQKLEVPTDYDELDALKRSVGTIESGPRAGERLPVNRRTIGDSIIRDLQTEGLETASGSIRFRRNQAAMGTAAGLAGIGWLGTPASAYETHVRKSISDETKNPIDQFQTAVSGISLAADAFGPKGEFVSTPADMLNEGIDDTRTLLSDPVEYLKNKAADVVGNPLMNPLDMVKMAMPGTQENNAVLGVVNGSINWAKKQWDNHYLNEDKEEEESPISVGFTEGGF
jgi:hypothetical protein